MVLLLLLLVTSTLRLYVTMPKVVQLCFKLGGQGFGTGVGCRVFSIEFKAERWQLELCGFQHLGICQGGYHAILVEAFHFINMGLRQDHGVCFYASMESAQKNSYVMQFMSVTFSRSRSCGLGWDGRGS